MIKKRKFLLAGEGLTIEWVLGLFKEKQYSFVHFNHTSQVRKQDLQDITHVLLPPGIKDCELMHWCHQLLIPIINELDLLYFEYPDSKFIAITGSVGKTSFVHKVAHVFRNSLDQVVHECGNMGISPFEKKAHIFIIEVSSFQLEKSQFIYFDDFIVLNIQDTHRERYDCFEHYKATKLIPIIDHRCKKYYVNFSNEDVHRKILNDLCEKWSISQEKLNSALKTFVLPKSRQEIIYQNSRVKIIDDGASTNMHSLRYATDAINPDYLICGGYYLNSPVHIFPQLKITCHILLYGEGGKEIYDFLEKNCKNTIIYFETFIELMDYVKNNVNHMNGTILFSPGARSFYQFKNYKERIEFFRQSIKQIASQISN